MSTNGNGQRGRESGNGHRDAGDETRRRLENDAERLRHKLADTLEALDRRRHDFVDLRLQARRHVPLIAGVGSALVLAMGGGIAFSIYRAKSRERRQRRERWRALQRMWTHPDQVAARADRSWFVEAGRRILIGAVTIVGSEMIKRFVHRAMAI